VEEVSRFSSEIGRFGPKQNLDIGIFDSLKKRQKAISGYFSATYLFQEDPSYYSFTF